MCPGRRREARPAEREVLQREAQRLGVGELALEQVERGRQGGELVVVQLELVEEVVLGAQRVELLAGELVALGVERHAERDQLRAVGVEAACERLVAHLGVALDVRLHVPGGQRPPLGHQEGDERELTDQLVRIVRHRSAELIARWPGAGAVPAVVGAARPRPGGAELWRRRYAAIVARSRCWCEGQ